MMLLCLSSMAMGEVLFMIFLGPNVWVRCCLHTLIFLGPIGLLISTDVEAE